MMKQYHQARCPDCWHVVLFRREDVGRRLHCDHCGAALRVRRKSPAEVAAARAEADAIRYSVPNARQGATPVPAAGGKGAVSIGTVCEGVKAGAQILEILTQLFGGTQAAAPSVQVDVNALLGGMSGGLDTSAW